MSENIDSVESTEVPSAEAVAPEATEVETVFFVIKDKDGQFKVVTDIGQKLKLDRVANISDIRMGCQEISRALDIRQTAETVVKLLNAQNTPPTE
jgi:hypothetical protein